VYKVRQSVIVAAGTPPRPPPTPEDAGRARRRLWASLAIAILAVTIGSLWDGAYHANVPFDSFWSPPHLYIYSMATLSALTAATLGFDRRLRACFGPGFRLPLTKFEMPGALVILGGGFAIIGLAGLLDDIWHSTFGLDETGWSTPHSMLGWGLFVAFLGFVASRLALARHIPMSRITPYVLGFFLLAASAVPFMGPIYSNHSPEAVQAVASFPALAMQPAFQHTARIYIDWDLTRTNPLFVPLAAFWCGAALAMVRSLDPRKRVLLGSALAFTLLAGEKLKADIIDQRLGTSIAEDPANYAALAVIVPAVLLAFAVWRRWDDRIGYGLAGLAIGLLAFATWGSKGPMPGVALALVFVAPLVAIAGSQVGKSILAVVKEPRELPVKVMVPILGIGMPLATGLIDLYLRTVTP